MAHGKVQPRHQRPFDAYGVVKARRRAGVEVVDDVDAAGKADLAIDHRQLAMQAPQAVAAKGKAANLGPVDQHFDARVVEVCAQSGFESARAETIHQHPHANATSRRARQCRRDLAAGDVIGEDVGFQVNFVARGVDGLDQRRKILDAGAQQAQVVAAGKAARGGC